MPSTTIDHISTILADRAPVLALVLVIVTAVFMASKSFGDTSNIPLIGKEYGGPKKRRKAYIAHARDMYAKGYETFKTHVFRLTTTEGDQYIVPRSLLDDLRRLPDDHLNMNKALDKMNLQSYTKHGSHKITAFVAHLVRTDLTRNLARINTDISEETARTVIAELPRCEDWTGVVVIQKLLRMVAIISGRTFLGPDLCRREEYIHSAINYTVEVFGGVAKLKQWNWWLRPIGQYYVPELQRIKEHKEKIYKFLKPIINERRQAMKEGKRLPDDMLQWMLNRSAEFGMTEKEICEAQLGLSVAAIRSTALTVALVLYDLVVRPELITELRDEITTVLANNGGVMTTQALHEMKLLDSVMKESQRTNPINLVRFQRYLCKPLVLKDGSYIPAGSIIQANYASIIQDPAYYTDPKTFNPRRFMDLRNSTVPDPLNYKNKEQYQYVNVTKDFMAFGYGHHACPGRFFAANEIKLILARMLIEYDMKMPDGITERYENIELGIEALPDPTKEIMLKRVKTA